TSTATDAHGNSATCTFTVTVNDVQLPVITCSTNRVVNVLAGTCSSNVTFVVTATDNCAVTNISSVPASGSSFPVGTTTVTSTARDSSGNSSTCTFTVTVTDTVPPTITCSSNRVVSASGTCASNVTFVVTATDNCPGVTVSSSPASGTSFPVGTTTVTSTATDATGNSSTCSFTVTVNDAQPPVITCSSNRVVSASQGTCARNV